MSVLKARMLKQFTVIKIGFLCSLVVIIALYFMLSPKYIETPSTKLLLSEDLEYLRKNGINNNLSTVDLDSLNTDQLLVTLHSYLDNNDVICQRKVRMGDIGDGGWEICDDLAVRPQRPCVIYSFGINYDFSFDDDAARLYGCHVYSFDPSMDKMQTSNRSDKVHFYKIGLSGRTFIDKTWKLYTLSDIRTMLGHQNTVIDVLKMDIESSEWGSIPEMISSGQMANIRQFLVEYHVIGTDRAYLLPRLKAIQGVEKAGYRKFYVHKNHNCKVLLKQFPVVRTQCYEVHYLR